MDVTVIKAYMEHVYMSERNSMMFKEIQNDTCL